MNNMKNLNNQKQINKKGGIGLWTPYIRHMEDIIDEDYEDNPNKVDREFHTSYRKMLMVLFKHHNFKIIDWSKPINSINCLIYLGGEKEVVVKLTTPDFFCYPDNWKNNIEIRSINGTSDCAECAIEDLILTLIKIRDGRLEK